MQNCVNPNLVQPVASTHAPLSKPLPPHSPWLDLRPRSSLLQTCALYNLQAVYNFFLFRNRIPFTQQLPFFF